MFEFDPTKPPNHRVIWVKVGGEPVDHERKYVVVTRGYMGRGKDGFDSLLVESEGGTAEEIVSEENGILISMMLRQYFMSLKILGKWKHWGKSLNRHWEGVKEDLHATHPVVEPTLEAQQVASLRGGGSTATGTVTPLDDSEDEGGHERVHIPQKWSEHELQIIRRVMRKWWRLAGLKGEPKCCDSIGEGEFMVDWTRVSDRMILDTASRVSSTNFEYPGNCTQVRRTHQDRRKESLGQCRPVNSSSWVGLDPIRGLVVKEAQGVGNQKGRHFGHSKQYQKLHSHSHVP